MATRDATVAWSGPSTPSLAMSVMLGAVLGFVGGALLECVVSGESLQSAFGSRTNVMFALALGAPLGAWLAAVTRGGAGVRTSRRSVVTGAIALLAAFIGVIPGVAALAWLGVWGLGAAPAMVGGFCLAGYRMGSRLKR